MIFATPAFADDPCKNLFDGEYIAAPGSGGQAKAQNKNTFYVIPGQKYTASWATGTTGGLNVYAYDDNDQKIGSWTTPVSCSNSPFTGTMCAWGNGETMTIPANVSYLVFNTFGTMDSEQKATWAASLQIERGSTATAYQPYNPLCATCNGTVVVENGESRCVPVIKIATNAYNDAQFTPVETALNSAVATIKDVVANTITQTAAIAQIASDKQTRPDSGCPQFRQCLLVEDEDGTPHWYQIKDPVRDLVLSLKNNKVNSAGETTTKEYAANGYDGTNDTTDSRYYQGYPAMRQLADGSTAVDTRQFVSSLLNGANGDQYKTLGEQEWAVTWDGNETGTANSFLPGVIYGVSRCAKTKPESTAVGTAGWNTIENSNPVNDVANIAEYTNCYCKMTGVGMDGDITPVKNSSAAPWVFYGTHVSEASCANHCAYYCAGDVRDKASFRASVLGFAVE